LISPTYSGSGILEKAVLLAIEVELLEVKKASIYKPSLQKMSDKNW
jgi:hypothetical protein